MYFCFVLLALLFTPFQSPQEPFRQRLEAAEAHRIAGQFDKAEAEYVSILADSYFKLGRIYSAQNNHQAAVAALEAATGYNPNLPSALVDLAIALFNSGQFKRAIVPLDKAIAVNPENASAYHMRGKCYFMLTEFEKSSDDLKTALRLAPRDYDVAYTLALAYLKRRQSREALQIFDRMIGELGDRPQLRILIGRAYRETGFLPEATEEFKKAAALDPHFPRVHYYLGLIYLLKDGASRIAEAEAEFKLEVAAHPDDFFANYYLGLVSTIGRKWDSALGFLQKAAGIQPNNPDPYFYLGQSYQGLAKHEQAIEMFRKAIALNPDLQHNDYQVTNAHYRLGQSLIKVGQVDEGRKELQISADLKSKAFKRDEVKTEAFMNAADISTQSKFSELVPARSVIAEANVPDMQKQEALKSEATFYAKLIAVAHDNIGLLSAEQKNFRKAAEHFKQAARSDPNRENIYYNLGLAYFRFESYKDAVSALESELKVRPTNLAARHLLGLSYFATENYPKAAPLLSEAIAAKPNDFSLYYPLAVSLAKQGQTEAVNNVVQRMLAAGSNSPQIHILLAKAYYDQGDGQKAFEELQLALALDSKVAMAHFYSGLVLLKMGKFAEAAREFENELVLNPADLQAKYHLAYVLLASQEIKRGMQLMQDVIAVKPDFGNAYFELGKAQLQQGDINGALKSLENAAKLEPDQAHVHYQLGRAYVAAGRKAEGEAQLERSRQLKEKARNQPNP